MKTPNVSPSQSMPSPSAPTAPTEGGTDFLALFNQVMEGTASDAGSPAIGTGMLPIADARQEDQPHSEPDDAEVAMMMAALTGVPIVPATPTFASTGEPGDMQSIASSVRANELTVVTELVSSQAGGAEEATQPQDSSFESLLVEGAPVDPRAAQNAIDALREVRAHQNEALVQRQVHAPVGTRAWGDELGAHVRWMTERGLQAASLRLSPEHLGPLEIRITIRDDQASVWFGAAHADTRAAIENALPRLREMMASQGLALNDAGVFKEAPRQPTTYRPEREGRSGEEMETVEGTSSPLMSRLGLVDAYA
jgi:flagellar hook-length control protein FliK